jgi:hypothetical protein
MDGSVPQRDLYRAHALECLEEARAVKDRELSNVFHRLAIWWVILGHQTEDDERGPRNATFFKAARYGDNAKIAAREHLEDRPDDRRLLFVDDERRR